MDLLFKRYASPFIFMDTLIQSRRFSDFVDEIVERVEDEREWEFFLHKVFDKSFNDFKESVKPREPVDVGTTVQNSFEMLNGFKPESG